MDSYTILAQILNFAFEIVFEVRVRKSSLHKIVYPLEYEL